MSSSQVRDLVDLVDRERAALDGFFHSDLWAREFPKIQLRTVGEMLSGNGFELPPHPPDYRLAQQVQYPQVRQARLGETG